MPKAKIQHSYRQLWLGLLGEHSKENEGQNTDRPGEIYFKTELHINFICTCKALTRPFAGNPYGMIFFKAEIPMTKMGKGKLQFFIT